MNYYEEKGGFLKYLRKTMRIMRLSLFLIVISTAMAFSANSYSQNTKLTLDLNNATVKEVLKAIENQSEFLFFYQEKHVDLDRQVALHVTDQDVEKILNQLFAGTDNIYVINDRQIVIGIAPRKELERQMISLIRNTKPVLEQPQQKEITGKVTDSDGLPMPGVSVIVKGTTIGTVTNADGEFSLSIPMDAETLQFSFVGMRTQEVPVDERTTFTVVMDEETIGIDEVVAIGYGTARRKDITGSVSRINMEDSPISTAPNFNALSALKSTTPGLNVGTINQAGGSPDLLIRGQNSITGSNDPLIVLDGTVFLGRINDINPQDIATYDILKDASSTAVYGSRAANGVIIITSKKGTTGKPTIRLNSSIGINVWQQKPDLENAERHIQKSLDKYGINDPLNLPELRWFLRENYEAWLVGDYEPVYWVEEASRIGQNQNYQLSVSGMGKGINYYFSSNYLEQEGVILGDDFQQVSLRGKLNTDITEWLEIGIDGNYSFRDQSGMGANMRFILQSSPFTNVWYDKENKIYEKWPHGGSSQNPLWDTNVVGVVEDLEHLNYYYLSTYAHLNIPFIKGLSFRMSYARGNNVNNNERFFPENYFISEYTPGITDRYHPETIKEKLSQANGFMERNIRYNYVIDNILNYRKQIGKHYFNATMVATRDYAHNKTIRIDGIDFEANGNTVLGVNGLHKADVQSFNISAIEVGNIGYLARLNYSLDDKYHLTASYRRDGSSVFGADTKWGNFPSIGLGWTVTEEDFLESVNFFNYLKLRASYGKNGNQGIGPYTTLTRIASGRDGNIKYEFGDDPSRIIYGMAISSLGNPNLGWETTTSFNGGIESVLYNNRVFLNLDFYFSETYDQLFVRQIPIMTGFSSIRASMGQVNNRGVEIELTTVNVQNQNFSWKTGLTFWQNRNVLHELYGDGKDDIGNNLFIGKSLGAIYGFETDGIVQEGDTEYINMTGFKPGYVKFKDISGPDGMPDGKIDVDYDRKILGYGKENFRLNFTNTVNFKNFELYTLFQGIFGGGKDNYYIRDNRYAFLFKEGGDNKRDWNHPYWTPENKNNSYPSPSYWDNRFLGVQSRAFIRIQDVTLAYRFDQPRIKKLNVQSVKLYVSINSTLTHLKYRLYNTG